VIRHANLIGINTIILGELLAGFGMGSRQAANVEELKALHEFCTCKIVPLG
jgi:hypothetical protein